MSVKLMAKAWELDLSQGEKLVLLALCDHANDDGICYPSQEYLAQKCSMSPRSLIDQINKLKKYGILTAERRQKNGGRLANVYTIVLDNFTQCANSAHAKSACENSACADSAHTNVQITADSCAKFAHSIKEEPSSNHQEEPSIYTPPSIEPKKKTGEKKQGVWAEGLALITDKGVNEQVAKDFIAVRKSHKAPLTMTALGRIEREAVKAGLTLEQAVCLCAEKGWRGFEAEWLTNSTQSMHSSKPSIKDVPKHTAGGVLSW